MVLKGPSNATDLNVLQGKAYEKPCLSQYIRDQYVLKGLSYTSNEPYSLCLFTYVHTVLKWLRGAKILQHTPVEKSQ